jgi:hypothetical protein
MSSAFTLRPVGAQRCPLDAMGSVHLTPTMTRTGSSNPDNFVHYRVSTIVGTPIGSMGIVYATADRKLLDESDAHVGDGVGISGGC